jgi:hypothetical protein
MSDPWLPARVPGFGPWIEGDKLPDDVKDWMRVHDCLAFERNKKQLQNLLQETAYDIRAIGYPFVAYCVQEV